MPEFESDGPIMSPKGKALTWWSAERHRPPTATEFKSKPTATFEKQGAEMIW